MDRISRRTLGALSISILSLIGFTPATVGRKRRVEVHDPISVGQNSVESSGEVTIEAYSIDIERPVLRSTYYYGLAYVKTDKEYIIDIWIGLANNPDKQKGLQRYRVPPGNWELKTNNLRYPRGCKRVNTRLKVYLNGSTAQKGSDYISVGLSC